MHYHNVTAVYKAVAYLGFVEYFDGVVLEIFLMPGQYNSCKRSNTNCSYQLEVIQRPFRLTLQ